MSNLSYRRHGFPVEIMQHAVWLYFRFLLSFRDDEDLLAERGIDVSYETVRRWSAKCGLAYARRLRRFYPSADTRWHLDEMYISISGKTNVFMACRGLRMRCAGCPGPITTQQESFAETDAQVTQSTRLRSNCGRDV